MHEEKARVVKSFFEISSLTENSDKKYWKKKTPLERLEALELMRQFIYGYDPANVRFQRFFEIAERE